MVFTFLAVKAIYSTRFKLVLNAIRDNEDKAEAMGIQTMKYKIIGWMISAFFCGLAGGIMGGLVGYIDSTDVAFDGREMGVFMVLMAILDLFLKKAGRMFMRLCQHVPIRKQSNG